MFYDTTSILIVVGGSTFVVLMKFCMGQFFERQNRRQTFMFKADEPEDLIAKVVEWLMQRIKVDA